MYKLAKDFLPFNLKCYFESVYKVSFDNISAKKTILLNIDRHRHNSLAYKGSKLWIKVTKT